MLRGFARVLERHPNAVLLLVGRGSLQPETEAVARELGLGTSVRFLGVRQATSCRPPGRACLWCCWRRVPRGSLSSRLPWAATVRS
jgi:glycosyltransferase involved in cell wall biosynthesis